MFEIKIKKSEYSKTQLEFLTLKIDLLKLAVNQKKISLADIIYSEIIEIIECVEKGIKTRVIRPFKEPKERIEFHKFTPKKFNNNDLKKIKNSWRLIDRYVKLKNLKKANDIFNELIGEIDIFWSNSNEVTVIDPFEDVEEWKSE